MSPPLQEVSRVVAVVVTYNPEPTRFAALLTALAEQVNLTLVVDNGSGKGIEVAASRPRLECIDMNGNAGIAAAQNTGIHRAVAAGATHVLLLDHDSLPAPQMTERLLEATRQLVAQGERVAAVGANYRDAQHAPVSPFISMRGLRLRRVAALASGESVPVSFLIGAGTLIRVEAIQAIGPMDDKLFIDYVDVEWCLRALSKGWQCFGVADALMDHRLGDDVLRWGKSGRPVRFLSRTLPTRSPKRHYYLFRNGSWLMLHGTMPLRWKVIEAKRLLACFVSFAIFSSPRHRQIRAMAAGTFDGVLGRFNRADWI